MSWAEVKKVNSDLTKPLDTLITESINTTLGGKADTAAAAVNTTNGVIAYVKGILNHLLTNMSSTRMAKIDTIAASTAVANGVIKSIQKGTHAGSSSNIIITISSVNANKAFVILDCSRTAYNSNSVSSTTSTPSLVSLSSTTLTVTRSSSYSSDYSVSAFSWQVVEFY